MSREEKEGGRDLLIRGNNFKRKENMVVGLRGMIKGRWKASRKERER